MQRLQREGRVADPRVAVVPVALAARGLRQRRRERGHRRAGRHVGEPLDRQRRALNRVTPAVVGKTGAAEPVAPEARRRGDPLPRRRRRRRAPRAAPPRRARSTPSRPARGRAAHVRGPRSIPSARSVWRRIVWPAPVASAVWRLPPTSVHSAVLAAVVEDRLADELDLDPAVEALHGAHEHVVGVVVGGRARVRRDLVLVIVRAHRQRRADDDPAVRRLPRRLEDVRSRDVHTRRRVVDAERRQSERPGTTIEQAAEHARRVEPRHAEPVDRAVRGDERPGVAVREERVVGDRRERRRCRRALGRLVTSGFLLMARSTATASGRARRRHRRPPRGPSCRARTDARAVARRRSGCMTRQHSSTHVLTREAGAVAGQRCVQQHFVRRRALPTLVGELQVECDLAGAGDIGSTGVRAGSRTRSSDRA